MVLIVLSSVIGAAAFHELGSNENNTIPINDFSSQKKTIEIELSDGTGSSDTG
ncbi:MAG: hypothetical protein ACREAK_01540 [Nitrosarchaeum sp.]